MAKQNSIHLWISILARGQLHTSNPNLISSKFWTSSKLAQEPNLPILLNFRPSVQTQFHYCYDWRFSNLDHQLTIPNSYLFEKLYTYWVPKPKGCMFFPKSLAFIQLAYLYKFHMYAFLYPLIKCKHIYLETKAIFKTKHLNPINSITWCCIEPREWHY